MSDDPSRRVRVTLCVRESLSYPDPVRSRVVSNARVAFALGPAMLVTACAGLLGVDDVAYDAQRADAGAADGGLPMPDGGSPAVPEAVADATRDTSCGASVDNDTRNCGFCGHDCLGGSCAAGQCQPVPLAPGQLSPGALVVDATHLYWAEFKPQQAIHRIAKNAMPGSSPTSIHVFSMDGFNTYDRIALALDATKIYWSSAEGNTVSSCPLAGCPGNAPNVLSASFFHPGDLAVAGQDLAIVDIYNEAIVLIDKDTGGNRRRIATATGTNGFDGELCHLVVQGALVYWSETTNGTIRSALLQEAASVSTVIGYRPGALAATSAGVFIANLGMGTPGGSISKTSTDFSATSQTMASGQSYPLAIASDGVTVYWVNEGTETDGGGSFLDGKLLACPVSGCGSGPKVLALGLKDPRSVAVDDSAVYFATAGDGVVWRLAK